MIVTHEHKTKILDGPASLGRSCIDTSTLTVDGGAVPAWMTIDATAGTVERTDSVADDDTLYTFVFECFRPARVRVDSDTLRVVVDSDVTLDVFADVDGDIPLSVYQGEKKLGNIIVTVIGGEGQRTVSVGFAGKYRVAVDDTIMDSTWDTSLYLSAGSVTIEVEDA